jgi:hypothetical protein
VDITGQNRKKERKKEGKKERKAILRLTTIKL